VIDDDTLTGNIFIGYGLSTSGTVFVDGSGSKWTSDNHLIVGDGGVGSVFVSNGGLLSALNIDVAVHEVGVGSLVIGGFVVLTAPGTINTSMITRGLGTANVYFNHNAVSYNFAPPMQGNLAVFHGGPGTTILSSAHTYTGDTSVDEGILCVASGSSISSPAAAVHVGTMADFSGTLDIVNDGTVTSATGVVAVVPSSLGTVTVDGAGSTWNNSGGIFIGSQGTGVVNVRNGAEVRGDAEILVNRFADGNGTLIVNGVGSEAITNGELRVADEGTGLMRIENGGTVTSPRG
jgi:T5SS/PEP-CTERM-associated repeat protein/autotransporter-associated beta strand protein